MKYAKWKAVELGKCLKSGIAPTPGPPVDADDQETGGYFPPQYPTTSGPGDATTSYGDKPVPKPRHNIHQDPQAPTGYVPDLQAPVGYVQDPRAPTSYVPDPQTSNPPAHDPLGFRYDQGDSRVMPPPTANPSVSVGASGNITSGGVASSQVGPEEVARAQKLCKFACSSLDYEDTASAVDYLQKALLLLTTGKKQ